MNAMKLYLVGLSGVLLFQSCIVSGPKFTNVEQVLELRPGMHEDTVSACLGIGPYDLNYYDSTGYHSYVYKYRLRDRKTVPFLLKETNGVKSRGKYMDLIAHYDSCDVAYRFESKYTNTELKEKRLNINNVITAITVTVPSVLVYLGITQN